MTLRTDNRLVPASWAVCGLFLGCLLACALSCAASCRPAAVSAHRPVEVTIPETPRATASGRPLPPAAESLSERLEAFEQLDAQGQEHYCRQRSGYADEDFERCSLVSVGNGAGLVLRIVTSCGGDSCGVLGWLLAPQLLEPFPLTDAGGTVEAAPDASFVLLEEERFGSSANFANRQLVTVRVEVPSGKRHDFADCFSPKLSPGGRYVVCRDRAANVLRVPLSGGPPEMLVDVQLAPEAVQFVPYAYLYPAAVEFRAADAMAFDVVYNDGAVFRRVVRWQE